uniref:Uncharacterized protein n=1 Tax=Leptocylindrus danicus TaxID=163516 RepID=A0A7S2KCB2_9STRA|mmetsp:Transcript_21081/g.31447  ORF Transcript_21081/g.31447 Transcript_21081/m.31447 type:complete len:154 (+) Transcript_21081:580-1041(+)|eukprot:CAMPEP_0116009280 /NCGR_PEP_ID=MMETSP0321-20121206/3343_1 /TAXON_ID=163516 /ORGANISM="Leptocylindrus danicus var. danicus, Strain B650" /LENGTH=153 /DNA_ID=CAMNT_0003478221 /DNA_START=584 /DNA_END=1045 /DNA_ORIENTATION=+
MSCNFKSANKGCSCGSAPYQNKHPSLILQKLKYQLTPLQLQRERCDLLDQDIKDYGSDMADNNDSNSIKVVRDDMRQQINEILLKTMSKNEDDGIIKQVLLLSKLIEDMLYRAASSFDDYRDMDTLTRRVQITARRIYRSRSMKQMKASTKSR